MNSQKVDNLSIQQHTGFAKLDENTLTIIESIVSANTETKEYLRRGFETLREFEKAEHTKTRAAFVAMDVEKRRVRIDLAFLESLRFPEMNHRYERVADAHKQTFLWAFRDPRPHEKAWDNFVEWLLKSNGTGCLGAVPSGEGNGTARNLGVVYCVVGDVSLGVAGS